MKKVTNKEIVKLLLGFDKGRRIKIKADEKSDNSKIADEEVAKPKSADREIAVSLDSSKYQKSSTDNIDDIYKEKAEIKNTNNDSLEKNNNAYSDLPSIEELKTELNRVKKNGEFGITMIRTIVVLICALSAAVIISSFFITVLKVSGSSMSPTFETGQIVIALNTDEFEAGDAIAFYYNNKVLIKRVIGSPGDWIDIDEDGNVSVNGVVLEETYISEKSLEPTDIEFPYQVPENKYFVLGDNRSVSIDSRSNSVGCISKEQLIGKIVFRVYPFDVFGKITY